MKNLINKIIFFWRKPKIVVSTDNNQETRKIVSQVLGSFSRVEREILFVDDAEKANLSDKKYLILNFDETNAKNFREKNWLQVLTFGFKEGADFQATDVRINGGTNFKVNYRGNIVPIWLKKPLNHEEIYSVLTAVAVGSALDLNLVEISQVLKGK